MPSTANFTSEDETSPSRLLGRIIAIEILVRRLTEEIALMSSVRGKNGNALEDQKAQIQRWMLDAIDALIETDIGMEDQVEIKRAAALTIEHNIEAALDRIEISANALFGKEQ
jgi:hypothetical protein